MLLYPFFWFLSLLAAFFIDMKRNFPPEDNAAASPPESFFSSNLSASKLRRWCLLTRFYLVINVAYLILLLLSQHNGWILPILALKAIDGVALLLWSYVLMSFRRLLWFRFHVTSVGVFINTLIFVGFLWWIVDGLDLLAKDYKSVFLGLILIIQGVAGMLLAKHLLASEIYTVKLKHFALILLAASVCYASLVMAFVGVALSLTAYWNLSCLFDEAAKERHRAGH